MSKQDVTSVMEGSLQAPATLRWTFSGAERLVRRHGDASDWKAFETELRLTTFPATALESMHIVVRLLPEGQRKSTTV